MNRFISFMLATALMASASTALANAPAINEIPYKGKVIQAGEADLVADACGFESDIHQKIKYLDSIVREFYGKADVTGYYTAGLSRKKNEFSWLDKIKICHIKSDDAQAEIARSESSITQLSRAIRSEYSDYQASLKKYKKEKNDMRKKKIGNLAVSRIRRNGQALLDSEYRNDAMTVARIFGASLDYRSSTLLSVERSGSRYVAKVKLYYHNVVDSTQYLVYKLYYNEHGNLLGQRLVDYSDVVTPNSLK